MKKYFGVYVSYPCWNQPSPPFDTLEEAQWWVTEKLKHKYHEKDHGYTFDEEIEK